MTPQPQYSGLAASEESQEPLVPHQSQDHLQGPLALHLLVQLDPGEGRGEGQREAGGAAGARTSCTGVNQGRVTQQAGHYPVIILGLLLGVIM